MNYCKTCQNMHDDEALCPHILKQLSGSPELLAEAANFTTITGQYHLITSQTLDTMAQSVNKVIGTNLSFEGTHQYIRDVQVFNQLNIDPYSKSGVFSSAKNAQLYYDQATKGQLDLLTKKLNGTGQEIDWLRMKQGELGNVLEKSRLLGANAPGIDGETINRLTGESISSTTIKAAQGTDGLGTNIRDVLKALDKGTLEPKDVLVGIEGTDDALQKALNLNIEKAMQNGDVAYAEKLKVAREHLKVEELSATETVKESTARLKDKVVSGQAHSAVTLQEVSKKAFQGAVIGAAIGLSVSAVSNYIKYKNGEITQKEAMTLVGRDTAKGTLIGGAMSTIAIFLPAGALGLVGGMAIGIFLNKTLTNVLDEVFGKGAYGAILDSAGFVYGMTSSLESSIEKIAQDDAVIKTNQQQISHKIKQIKHHFNDFDALMKGRL